MYSTPYFSLLLTVDSFGIWIRPQWVKAENTRCRGEYHCTAGLQFKKIGFDQMRNCIGILSSAVVESKLVNPETSHTVILPPWQEFSR